MADMSLSKNELKKLIRLGKKAGADPRVVGEANRIKSARLSEAQRLKATQEDAALWEAMAESSLGVGATAASVEGQSTSKPAPAPSHRLLTSLAGVWGVRPTSKPSPSLAAAPRAAPVQTKCVGRITVDLACKLYVSAVSTVYMGMFGSKPAVVKVTRSVGAESAGENKEEAIMQELVVSDCFRLLRRWLRRIADQRALPWPCFAALLL